MSAMKHIGWALATIVGFIIHPLMSVVIGALWLFTAIGSHSNERGVNQPDATESKVETEPEQMLNRVRLSSQGRIGAVGEYYRRKQIRALIGKGVRIGQVGDWDSGLPIEVELIPEPRNPHDRNAVALRGIYEGRSEMIGYLSRNIAPRWQRELLKLQENGQLAYCRAMIYRTRDSGFEVVLRLAEPGSAFFWNDIPQGAVVVDAERTATPIGVHRYQDVLADIPDAMVWATLSVGEIWSGKYAGAPTIDVSIEGQIIGQLNASQGARYMPVLSAGSLIACEAMVSQGSKNRVVKIWLPKY